jgi:hypothetical protein
LKTSGRKRKAIIEKRKKIMRICFSEKIDRKAG